MLLKAKVDVSVILCAYNEGNVIEDAIAKVDGVMRKSRWSYEIVVVDDGSWDDTRQKAVAYTRKNSDRRLIVVGYERNMGKGNAIKTGFAHSRGDFIVVIDSDLDVDPTLIPSYVETLKRSDVAVASKWHPKSRTTVTFKRKILSFGFNALSKIFTGIKLRDTQTGLKAFRREVLERLAPKFVVNRYAFDLELVGACNHSGYNIVELPVNVHIDSMVSFRDVLRMALDMLRIAYRLRILKYYQRY
jgi:glycosyltransferase involved in cell wall biosynthesis